MQLRSLLVLASLALTASAGVAGRQEFRGRKGKACPTKRASETPIPSSTTPPASYPTLPANGGTKELSAPPAEKTLKHIVLGHGYQNYTCAGAGATAAAAGALAVLYDVMPLYPAMSLTSLDLSGWLALTTTVSWTQPVPLNTVPGTEGRQSASELGASATEPFPARSDLDLSASGLLSPLPFKGHHYFDSAGVPVFALDGGDTFLGKKNDSIVAPASASKGEDGGAAVAWLLLDDKGGSNGISIVYRVDTVGGSPHACEVQGTDSSVYTAMYFMYG